MSGSIVATGIHKSFSSRQGALSVIEGIDLSVADGEFVALVGPSGCGKSTLLDILAGFVRPDRGEVQIDGEPVGSANPRHILIPQQPSVFPWLTARRNITFVLDGVPDGEQRRLAFHYLDLVGLEGFDQSYPHQLSGGMVKRLELARALAVKPDVLYMDEPFGALDALTRRKMRDELRRILLVERHTALLVTHDVEEALHLADRIVVMSPRPTKIQCIVDVPFPHPRRLVSVEMIRLAALILSELGVETES
ncbi:MAG: ABC transporter ATP-binding protein [Gemmatimonadetes bacterium]|nr:ABC transporter ATP-binding protein [Gemmatimonadota bacterium]